MKYKFLPHTADIKFQAFGKTIEEAFENSFYALKKCILKDKMKVKEKLKKNIKIKGNDLSSLLYDFLEEFLYLLDAEGFLLSKIKDIEINEKKFVLTAEVYGDNAKNYRISNDVKAITYNEMFVRQIKKKWVVQVVVDV